MTNKAIIHTENAPAAIGTYSQAVKVNNTVYLSGQIPSTVVQIKWTPVAAFFECTSMKEHTNRHWCVLSWRCIQRRQQQGSI